MNFLDRIILSIAPRAAEKRLRARKKVEFMQAYEGASTGRRGANWRKRNTSANTEIRAGGAALRATARDLVRNDGWAARAKQVIVNNTIGTGIVPSIPVKRAAKVWEQWAGTSACDHEGLLDFYGLQDLVMATVVESGEALIRRVPTSSKNGVFPLRIQVLEPDFLVDTKSGGTSEGGRIVDGKEYNSAGVLTHYWLHKRHPGDDFQLSQGEERVPARDIIHVFRVDRAGQQRGVTWYAPIIVRMLEFAEYDDAQLVKQKISSKWAAFVYDSDVPTAGQVAQEMSETIEAGAIEYLPPGKEITFPNMPDAGDYTGFSKMQLHAFAAGLGVTYEALTGFWDDTNFASGRMGWVEMFRNIQVWRRKMIIPQMCRGVFSWFSDACVIAGIPTVKSVTDVTWTPPRREMFDPSKEIKPQIEAIQAGIKSLTGTWMENGDDVDKMVAALERDQEILDKIRLKLKSDYRNEMSNKPSAEGDQTNTDNNTGAEDEDDADAVPAKTEE